MANAIKNETWDTIAKTIDNYNCDKEDLKELGVKNPQDARRWISVIDDDEDIGYVGPDIKAWYARGITSSKEAQKWKFTKIKDCVKGKNPYCEYDSFAESFSKFKISPKEALVWQKLDLRDRQYKKIYKNKMSLSEYKSWKNNNVKFDNMIEWKKAGFNKPEEALIWINAGVTNAKFIKMLKDIGINNVEEYEPFSHINTISQMKLLKDLGYKRRDTLMEQLSKFDSMSGQVHGTWISYKNLFFKDQNTLLSRIKTLDKYNCTTLEEDYFSTSDPYYNKGNCYIAGLSLFQRLGKDYGLAKGINGEVIFVSFDKPIKKGQAIHGVIMGLGHYKYTNSYGSTKIISKGHIILQQ